MQAQATTIKKAVNRNRGGHLRLEKDQVGDSPQIGLRVNGAIYAKLLEKCEAEKTTISALTRKALAQLVGM